MQADGQALPGAGTRAGGGAGAAGPPGRVPGSPGPADADSTGSLLTGGTRRAAGPSVTGPARLGPAAEKAREAGEGGDGTAGERPRRRRWGFVPGLVVIAAVALAVRVVYVFGWHHPEAIAGDAYYYHYGANLLADGHGFIHPYRYVQDGIVTPGAQHPPLYIIALSAGSLVGLSTYLDHQLLSCLLGTATVVLVGLAGRQIANARVGLIAAMIAAGYPNLWFNDALVMSETMIQLTTAVTVLVAYRFARRRSLAAAAGLGVAVGLAALSRAEAVLLPVLLVAPLCLFASPLGWRRRIGLLLVSGAASVAVLAPWVGYNAVRYAHPVYLSSGFDPTLAVSNCDDTYFGQARGYWSYRCITAIPRPLGDESEQVPIYRKTALDYMKAHKGDLPGVAAARVGRTFGFYKPIQQITLDTIETRELPASKVALGVYYALVAASIGGVVALRRRRVPLAPLLALIVNVAIAVAITFGQTRYRASAEIAFVLLAAVALDALWRAARRSGRLEPWPRPAVAGSGPGSGSGQSRGSSPSEPLSSGSSPSGQAGEQGAAAAGSAPVGTAPLPSGPPAPLPRRAARGAARPAGGVGTAPDQTGGGHTTVGVRPPTDDTR